MVARIAVALGLVAAVLPLLEIDGGVLSRVGAAAVVCLVGHSSLRLVAVLLRHLDLPPRSRRVADPANPPVSGRSATARRSSLSRM
jgi:hypothetical protein